MRVISGIGFARAAIGFVSASFLAWPAVGAETSPIPDFSGIWGRNWAQLEQPPSGPGPIVRVAEQDARTRGTLIGDHTSPILKPEASAALKKRGEIGAAGTVVADPVNQCWPEPTPLTLAAQFGMQMLQHKDGVTIFYIGDHKVRHIRMNSSHPTNLTPTWQGDSIGHYEGDTLVIDTVGQKVGPLSVLDLLGTPFSPALHVIERYRLIDGEAAREAVKKREFTTGRPSRIGNVYGRGDIDTDPMKKGLQVEITVEDPNMFTAPWKALITYQPATGRWPEAVCAEAPHLGVSQEVSMPQAEKPDF